MTGPTGRAAEPVVPSDPVSTYFLDLATIPGAATAKGFAHQIPLLGWQWGVDASGSVLVGGGGGAGRPTPQDVIVLARTDVHSPKVLAALNTGHHLATALISCVRPGNRPVTFLTLALEEVLVTGYRVSPGATDGYPVDTVRLEFAKVTQRFYTQHADGTVGDPVQSSFDYRTSSPG